MIYHSLAHKSKAVLLKFLSIRAQETAHIFRESLSMKFKVFEFYLRNSVNIPLSVLSFCFDMKTIHFYLGLQVKLMATP